MNTVSGLICVCMYKVFSEVFWSHLLCIREVFREVFWTYLLCIREVRGTDEVLNLISAHLSTARLPSFLFVLQNGNEMDRGNCATASLE